MSDKGTTETSKQPAEEAKPKTRKKQSEKDKLKARISELESEVAELKNKNLRLFAEFENFRKRTAREKLELMETASRDLIVDLLPVLDDLERARQAAEGAKDIESVIKGYDLIVEKLWRILEQRGLKPMESKGQPFDPELHDAMTELPVKDKKSKGTVIDEIEKGYFLKDKIIRHARVVVGK